MSMHKIPLTTIEEAGLRAHGLDIGTPSQLSDAFRQGVAFALKAQAGEPDFYVRRRPSPGYEVVSSSDPMAQPAYLHPTTERRVPDRAEFERQAKYQGVTDFSLNQDGFRTYANDIAEMAWRLWANKGNAAPTKSRSTLAEEYEKGLSICEAEYRKLQGEYDRLAEALETEKRFTARCDEIERELEGQKKANGFLALKAQAGEHIRRWNIEPDGDDLLICDGNHDKHEKCEYIRYTPASTVKAQAGEPVGYHFSYTTPFGHVVWDIDYTPRPDAIECYPLVRAHPTTEHPYNPLNDYAVISMNPTEPVKAQAGESVDYRYKATDGVRYSK